MFRTRRDSTGRRDCHRQAIKTKSKSASAGVSAARQIPIYIGKIATNFSIRSLHPMSLATPSGGPTAETDHKLFTINRGCCAIQCLVSHAALRIRDGVLCDHEGSFQKHREEIEEVAGRKYDAGQIHASGSAVVTSRDLNPELFIS
jgi:hypothetical protein